MSSIRRRVVQAISDFTNTSDRTSVRSAVRDAGISSQAISDESPGPESRPPSPPPKKRQRRATVIRRSTELDAENFILPPFVLAKQLVDNFFTYAYALYPILHEPTFREKFEATYQDSSRPTADWLSVLNLVFAFGCDYLELSLHDAFEMAQTFHDRGAELILSVCFEQSTIQIVQALFLLTGHLQSDLKMNKSWLSIGCLVRTAQGLGLNFAPSKREIHPVDQEIRKRLWWGIYSLDR